MQSIVRIVCPYLAFVRTPGNSGSGCGDSGLCGGNSALGSGDSATTRSSTTSLTGSSGLLLRVGQAIFLLSPELSLLGLGWFSKSILNISCLLRCKAFLELSLQLYVLIKNITMIATGVSHNNNRFILVEFGRRLTLRLVKGLRQAREFTLQGLVSLVKVL